VWIADVALLLRDGVPGEYKYLQGDSWERTPNRRLLAQARPDAASAQVQRDSWEYDAQRTALKAQVLQADALFFAGLNQRNIQALRDGFSRELEFFHDRTGFTGYAHNIAVFERAISSGQAPTRELLPGSEVFALGEFGAMHQGWHAFCEPARPGSAPGAAPNCGSFRFMHLWQRQPDGGLKLHRVVSYDH
jgi:hypothetical protein